MNGDRNKEIHLHGVNLSRLEKLEISLARKLMNHIDCCSHEELLRIAKLILKNDIEVLEVRLFEEELKNPS